MWDSAPTASREPAAVSGFRSVGDAARELLLRIPLSGATFDLAPRRNRTHGGARNRADRTSEGLSLHQCERIAAAALAAFATGTALNRFVTIHWGLAGISDARGAWATGRFIKLASDWCRTRGAPFLWLWVRENGASQGGHVHMLLYVPPDHSRAFAAMQRGWLRRVTGRPYRRGVIKTRPIGGSLRAAETVPEHYRTNLANVAEYMLKGAMLDAAEVIGLGRRESSEVVIGKRAGWCQKLVSKSRSVTVRNSI